MRLLLDVMCGGLVSYLRMCNYDTASAGDRGIEADDDLLALARAEGRTLLTRDVQLASRSDDAILLESREVEDQLRELAATGLDLSLADEPAFCGRCNGPLTTVSETASTPEYAPDGAATTVWRCQDCGQHFWRGSHWDRVAATLARVTDAAHTDDQSGTFQ
ncbi:Mut7-C RNAse domain-containing protein [Natrarchaeobaculum sulfurireducens]|uniref:PIN-domain and Zn ribbon n=2 Tax=Natrarchaeobaculum sulfurireducens TaxID=2044521 RepID=A0A346PBS9_9EURY|nr:Mut7-C RNAse domain-containing protein [Natrarchaeobaculum sulfurireducens]AXR76974.1 PIN-domain and Zn ribbon [Natrarchaeobaculum sulfurireducens]